MSISLDELNATHVPADIFTDRWLFQLAEEFSGPHAGAVFDQGRAVEPVDFRVFRKFVVNYGRSMIGAIRVVGEPVELGDCSALRKQLGLADPKAKRKAAPEADELQAEEPAPTPSHRPPADVIRSEPKGKHR